MENFTTGDESVSLRGEAAASSDLSRDGSVRTQPTLWEYLSGRLGFGPQTKQGGWKPKRDDRYRPMEVRSTNARNPKRTAWNPIWLQLHTLVGFVLLFAALAVALGVLLYSSTTENGFHLVFSNHYAWTYGPTAVFVFITSLWRQVDFWMRTLMPWKQLIDGYSNADQNLLLDYISPLISTALWKAFRKGHVQVVLTVLGFIILKLATVASTGLLRLANTQMMRTLSISAVSRFNGSLVNSAPGLSKRYTGNTVWNFNGMPYSTLYTAYALLAQGLNYPEGTTPAAAYQRLEWEKGVVPANASIQAEVNAFFPTFECETAQITVPNPNFNSSSSSTPINVTSASCDSILVDDDGDDNSLSIHTCSNYEEVDCTTQSLRGTMIGVNCLKHDKKRNSSSARYLLTMQDVHYDPLRNISNEYAVHVAAVTGVLCTFSYSMDKTNLTYDTSSTPFTIKAEIPSNYSESKLPEYTDNTMRKLVRTVLSDAPTTFSDLQRYTNLGSSGADSLSLFYLMTKASGLGYKDFLNNGTLMISAAKQVFSTIAVLATKSYVMEESKNEVASTLTYEETRLHVVKVPLFLMLGGVLIMLCLTIVVLAVRPLNVVPRTPDMMTKALILSRSLTLQNTLADLVGQQAQDPQLVLAPYLFRSDIRAHQGEIPRFTIEGARSGKAETENRKEAKNAGFWTPLAVQWPTIAIILGLSITVIIATIILQRVSDNHDGIVDFPTISSFSTAIYTRYIPAGVMLLIASLFNALDFAVITFSAYSALKKGQTTARRSLMGDLMSKNPLNGEWLALNQKNWGAGLSIAAAFLGSFLTIVVSGLYTVRTTSVPGVLQALTLDHFNTSWNDSATDDRGAAVITSLIEDINLPFPHWTWEDLVFPTMELSIQSAPKTVGLLDTLVYAQLPALRPELSCDFVPQDSFSVSFVTGGQYKLIKPGSPTLIGTRIFPYITLNMTRLGYKAANSADSSFQIGSDSTDDMVFISETNSSFTGQQFDLSGVSPSIGFAFGHFDYNAAMSSGIYRDNITVMVCSQHIVEIQISATLILPDLRFSTEQPPVAIGSDSTSSVKKGSDLGYRLQQNIELLLNNFNDDASMQYYSGDFIDTAPQFGNGFDPFYYDVIYGSNPIAPADLTGPSNRNRLLNATQALYGRYMAQAISANMRRAFPSAADNNDTTSPSILSTMPQTYTLLTTFPQLRLYQSAASALTLQIFLAVMIILGMLAYSLTSFQNTLQYNPHSIAGAATLFVGSSLCGPELRDLIPDGAEWISDDELEERGFWSSWKFSLRWWGGKGKQTPRWGIDVDVDAAERCYLERESVRVATEATSEP